MNVKSKVQYLIVDTSAFIKNAPLKDVTNKIITEQSVLDEIKSKRQLRRLVIFPCQVDDIEVKEAFSEDIAFVTEFAKKTGDYSSLSLTDIKVIALTLRYEREKVGTDHLRKEPEVKKKIVDSSVDQHDDQAKNLAGFYMPKGNISVSTKDSWESNDSEEVYENEQSSDKSKNNDENPYKVCVFDLYEHRKVSECSDLSTEDSQQFVIANDLSDESKLKPNYNRAVQGREKKKVDDLNKKFGKLNCDPTELKVDCEGDLIIDDILKPIKNNFDKVDEEIDNKEGQESNESSEEDYDNNDDESNGWITPSNIKNVKVKMDSGVVQEKSATVACLTMDYAMQNVMMHMGLNICSLEGKVIRQMRTFILRCYTCFKTTGIVTKVFCPTCGHKTLKKVAVSLDDKGNQIIHINYRKPLTSKGKKFSLPTFKGGKHACNPILFEDQPLPDQRPTKLGRARNDPLNEDYLAGYSPFVMRDVNSRAAVLGIKSDAPMKYWMRRNPNEAKKHRK